MYYGTYGDGSSERLHDATLSDMGRRCIWWCGCKRGWRPQSMHAWEKRPASRRPLQHGSAGPHAPCQAAPSRADSLTAAKPSTKPMIGAAFSSKRDWHCQLDFPSYLLNPRFLSNRLPSPPPHCTCTLPAHPQPTALGATSRHHRPGGDHVEPAARLDCSLNDVVGGSVSVGQFALSGVQHLSRVFTS